MTGNVKNTPPPIEEDFKTVRNVLRAARRFAATHKYGGMYKKWQRAVAAIEALDRIEDSFKKRQLELW